MSDTPTTLGLVTLSQEYRGDVVRQINRKCATLKMLRVVQGEGKNIAWAPEGDGSVVENYAEGADASNFGQDVQTAAYLSWSLYRGLIHVTNLAMDGASTSQSPEGNRQLWARALVNSSAKLASQLNQQLFAATGSGTTMTGLSVAIAAARTYATVDSTSATYFDATVVDPGTPTAVTFALIRDDLRKIYEACGETPDMAVCSPAVFNKVGALFDATRRQIDSVRGGNGMVKLEFGFQALEVDGTVFYRDKDCTAQTIYYLNSEHVEIQYLPSASQAKLIEAAGGEMTADDGFGPVPLGFKYEMLAKTGASEKAEILWTGNLVVDRPNTCGVRKNVLDS